MSGRIVRALMRDRLRVSPVAVPLPPAPAPPVSVLSPGIPDPFTVSLAPAASRRYRDARRVYGSNHTPTDRAVLGPAGVVPYEDATSSTGPLPPPPEISPWPTGATGASPYGAPATGPEIQTAGILGNFQPKTLLMIGGALFALWALTRKGR
jgi:hypothetical protein